MTRSGIVAYNRGMATTEAGLFGTQSEFVRQSVAGLQVLTRAHDSLFGLGSASWHADLQTGTLTFTNERYRAVCPVQVIGTYDTRDSSWLWGWDHPSVPEGLAEHAKLVRAFATRQGLSALLTPALHCSEEDIWAFAALAVRLAGAQGAYRGPAGTTLVMMTFGAVQLGTP
ncbi:DUF6882 domain-containing protein [Deinococcus sp.]|uniref:DUF6882 domain-containing protein n=1 Tax=Deinococcus sp. TaxID=47478 RepID=UPI003C7AEA5E